MEVTSLSILVPRKRMRHSGTSLMIDSVVGLLNVATIVAITVTSLIWDVSFYDTFKANLCWITTYARILGDDSIFEHYGMLGEYYVAAFNALTTIFVLQDYYGVWAAAFVPLFTSIVSSLICANILIEDDGYGCSELVIKRRTPTFNLITNSTPVPYMGLAFIGAIICMIYGVTIGTLWGLGYDTQFRLMLWFSSLAMTLLVIASINYLRSLKNHRFAFLTLIAITHFPVFMTYDWVDLTTGGAIIGGILFVNIIAERERDNLKLHDVDEDSGECVRACSKVGKYTGLLLTSSYFWMAIVGVCSITVSMSIWRPVSEATYHFPASLSTVACDTTLTVTTLHNTVYAMYNSTASSAIAAVAPEARDLFTGVVIAAEKRLPYLNTTCWGITQEYIFPYDPIALVGLIMLLFPAMWLLFSAFPLSRTPMVDDLADLEDFSIVESTARMWNTIFIGSGILLTKIAIGPVWLGAVLSTATRGTYSNVFTDDGKTLLVCLGVILFSVPMIKWLLSRKMSAELERRAKSASLGKDRLSPEAQSRVILRGLARFIFSMGFYCMIGAVVMLAIAVDTSSVDSQIDVRFTPLGFQDSRHLPDVASGSYSLRNPFGPYISSPVPYLTTNVTTFNTTTNITTVRYNYTTLGEVMDRTLFRCTSDPSVLCNMNYTLAFTTYSRLKGASTFSRADQSYTNPWDSMRWLAIVIGMASVLVAIVVCIGYAYPGGYVTVITLLYYALAIVGVITEVSLLQMIAIARNSFPDELTVTVYIPTTLIIASFLAVLAFGYWWQNGMSAFGQRDLAPSDKTRAMGRPQFEPVTTSSGQSRPRSRSVSKSAPETSRRNSNSRVTIALGDD